MRYDPLHLFTPILNRLQSFKMSDSFIVLDGYVFTQDGKTALAFLTSAYGMSESLHNNELNELLNGKRALSAEMALLIGHALDIEAEPLLALQMKYNLLSAKRNKSFLERLKEIPKIAAIF